MDRLPDNWMDVPYPPVLSKMIKDLIALNEYVGVLIPSAQSIHENNVLLFPDHPKFKEFVKEEKYIEEKFHPRLKPDAE